MNLVTIIIETPKGSAFKYKYQPGTPFFKLHKVLPAGMFFPFDFGFVPDTTGEDGDPLDIIVISEFPTFTGCMMECRIIGGIGVQQAEKDGKWYRNDRFIGVPAVSQLYANIKDITQLPTAYLDQLEAFFKNYCEQSGKQFTVLGRMGPEDGYSLIQKELRRS